MKGVASFRYDGYKVTLCLDPVLMLATAQGCQCIEVMNFAKLMQMQWEKRELARPLKERTVVYHTMIWIPRGRWELARPVRTKLPYCTPDWHGYDEGTVAKASERSEVSEASDASEASKASKTNKDTCIIDGNMHTWTNVLHPAQVYMMTSLLLHNNDDIIMCWCPT